MPSPQKGVAVAYERWSLARGSNYRLLTGKNLVFWIGGRLWLGGGRLLAKERLHMGLQSPLAPTHSMKPLIFSSLDGITPEVSQFYTFCIIIFKKFGIDNISEYFIPHTKSLNGRQCQCHFHTIRRLLT